MGLYLRLCKVANQKKNERFAQIVPLKLFFFKFTDIFVACKFDSIWINPTHALSSALYIYNHKYC